MKCYFLFFLHVTVTGHYNVFSSSSLLYGIISCKVTEYIIYGLEVFSLSLETRWQLEFQGLESFVRIGALAYKVKLY